MTPEEQAAYDDAHAVCPQCLGLGDSSLFRTTAPLIADPTRDTNRAECSCGWGGIVDDLVPAPVVIAGPEQQMEFTVNVHAKGHE